MGETESGGYRYITFDDDSDEEEVYHAGAKRDRSVSPTEAASGAVSVDAVRAESTQTGGAASTVRVQTGGDAGSDNARPTAEERAREERRRRAEEVAAMEEDLKSAGRMSKPQTAIIIVSVAVLIVVVAYIVWTFAV